MNRELARDIFKAVQNASNHFVASKTAKVGSTIRLTHPVGKAIFAQALTPLSGSCLVFEQNGQWFAVAGAERTETNSTTVLSRRSRPRGKTATEFEVAYLFTETVDDNSQLPFVVTVYGFDPVELACYRKPLNRRESGYNTPEDCKTFSTFSYLEAPYNDYFETTVYKSNNVSFPSGQAFTSYSYEGNNSNAATKLQNLNAHQTIQLPTYKFGNGNLSENETYLVTASGSTELILVYQRLVPGGVEYMQVSYRRDLAMATGTLYCKSNRAYTDNQDNEIVRNQRVFPFPHTTDQILAYTSAIDSRLNNPNKDRFNALNPSLSISLNCSHATLNHLATEDEVFIFQAFFANDVTSGSTNNRSVNFGGTGTISGSDLINGALNISATASGTVPSSVQFYTEYFNGQPQSLETFEYAGYLPINFKNIYVSPAFSTRTLGVTVHPPYKTRSTTGKRVFYLQRKNEQPIKVLELPKQEGFECLMTSSLTGFSIIIKAGVVQGSGYPYNATGWYRVFLIEVSNNSTTPQVDIYNLLDNDTIPVPENNWLSLHYNYALRRNIELTPSNYGSSQDALILNSSLPYWHNPSPVEYFFSKFTYLVLYLVTNINTFNSGKTFFYFESADLIDRDPILYIEPLTEPIFVNSYTLGYQTNRNARFVISAFLTGNFTNWTLDKKRFLLA